MKKYNNWESISKVKVIKAKARNYRQMKNVVEHTVLFYIGLIAQCSSESKILKDQTKSFLQIWSNRSMAGDTLVFSAETLITESLEREVWEVEKSSRIEHREVPETSLSIDKKIFFHNYGFYLLSTTHTSSVTALGCSLKSVRQTNQTPVAFNKSLDLKMKKVRTGKFRRIPGVLTLVKILFQELPTSLCSAPAHFPKWREQLNIFCYIVGVFSIRNLKY